MIYYLKQSLNRDTYDPEALYWKTLVSSFYSFFIEIQESLSASFNERNRMSRFVSWFLFRKEKKLHLWWISVQGREGLFQERSGSPTDHKAGSLYPWKTSKWVQVCPKLELPLRLSCSTAMHRTFRRPCLSPYEGIGEKRLLLIYWKQHSLQNSKSKCNISFFCYSQWNCR